jgi:hypothetical protein
MKTNPNDTPSRRRAGFARLLPVAALAILLTAGLAGCGDEDSPAAPSAPAKTTKTVTVTVSEVLVIASCENSSTNPGDFTYELYISDPKVDDADEQLYTGSFSGRALETDDIDDIVIEMEREPESGDWFQLVFEVYEWDADGAYDDRMAGSMGTGHHKWNGGDDWDNGPHQVSVSGSSECRVSFVYSVDVK